MWGWPRVRGALELGAVGTPGLLNSLCFPGCPKPASVTGCRSNQTAFHGCLQMLNVDMQPVDVELLTLQRLAQYYNVYFNVCGITDRYQLAALAATEGGWGTVPAAGQELSVPPGALPTCVNMTVAASSPGMTSCASVT